MTNKNGIKPFAGPALLSLLVAGAVLLCASQGAHAALVPVFTDSISDADGQGGSFFNPIGIATDSSDRILVADTGNNRVQIFDSDGTFVDSISDADGQGGSFFILSSVATDSSDRILVVDTGHRDVQIFDSDGTFVHSLTDADGQGGSFFNPIGIATDSSDRILVADTGNKRVQIFEYLPEPEPEPKKKRSGGDNKWNTRPTFGPNHENIGQALVENGFGFNAETFTVTDSHHTPFEERPIRVGEPNSFSAKVYASKQLMVQEFLFGIPGVGQAHLAELGVEVWYGSDGKIKDIKVVQESDIVDADTISVTHAKDRCSPADREARCDLTTVSMVFLEPLRDKTMAIKAIDFKSRFQITYLNDGFDVSGDSLNPMPSKMIPSKTKGEGLLKVTQVEKYSPYWASDDGRVFEMNSFGSFMQVDRKFDRFQDTGDPRTRTHSGFSEIVASEQDRARDIFDSATLASKLPESFAHDMKPNGLASEQMMREILLQQQIAHKVLCGMGMCPEAGES